jgi:hypothetical protein
VRNLRNVVGVQIAHLTDEQVHEAWRRLCSSQEDYMYPERITRYVKQGDDDGEQVREDTARSGELGNSD